MEFRKSVRGKKIRQDIAAIKAASIVILAFLISWTPYAIVCTYAQFGANTQAIIGPYSVSIAACFAKVSSIFNPALYTLSNPQCMNYFRNRILKLKLKRGQKSSNQFVTSSNFRMNVSVSDRKRSDYLKLHPPKAMTNLELKTFQITVV